MDSDKSLIRLRELIAIFLLYFAVAFAIHQPGFHSAMIYDSAAWVNGKANVFAQGNPIEVIRTVPARPLFMMSLYANYVLAGMDPYFFRVCNAAILGAAGAALMLLTLLIFSLPGQANTQPRIHRLAIGGFLGLLFTVHPLQSFVVLYVWQREAILACFFYFSALATYLAIRSGRLSPPPQALVLVGVLFFAGLLTKENVATLPLTLIIAEVILFKENRKEFIQKACSIGAITLPPLIGYLYLTWILHGAQSEHPQGIVNRLLTYYGDSGLTLVQVVLTETRVVFSYLLTIVAPFWDNPQFMKAEIVSTSLWNPPITMAAFAGIIVMIYLAIRYREERPVEAFGIIFYLVALAPESLLIPHYLFFGYRPILSMAGILLILGRVIVPLVKWSETKPQRRAYRFSIVAVWLILVIAFGLQTFRQATRWNPLNFWSDAYLRLPALSEQVEKRPYWDILMNFSSELFGWGMYAKGTEVLKRATPLSRDAETVIAMLPDLPSETEKLTESTLPRTDPTKNQFKLSPSLLINLGLALKRNGKIQDAIRIYGKALEIDPTSAIAHNHLGMALQEGGNASMAVEQYRRALALTPDFPEALYNLGNSLREIGDLAQSAASLRKAIELRPDYAQASESLGYTLLMSGKFADAGASLRRALAVNWRNANVHNALGIALAEQGKAEQAEVHFKMALSIDPGHKEAQYNLDMLPPTNRGPIKQ